MAGCVPRCARQHDGQVLVLFVLMVVVVIALAGALIDGGSWLVARRDMQGVADAAALAGVRELPTNQGAAYAIATDYVLGHNAGSGAGINAIDVSSSTVTATVQREGHIYLTGVLGFGPPTIGARARAQVFQMAAPVGMLPLALIRDQYVVGDQTPIKTAPSKQGNYGAIRPPYGDGCADSNGANDFETIIIGEARGGTDACAVEPGDTIQTETGNMSGPTRSGFAERIGDNVQSIDEVFSCTAGYTGCTALDPTSPRIGVVPVIEGLDGSTTWPNGSGYVRVVQYVFVYIGKIDSPPGYPAQTEGGKTVWVTPVDLVELPEGWDAIFNPDIDPGLDAPLSYRLVE